jgi:hypothetical protein
MRYRGLVLGGVLAAMIAMAWAPTAGQAPKAGWTPTKTAWGDPDIQGFWRGLEQISFERNAQFEGREFLTEKEIADKERFLNDKNEERGKGKQENRGFREQANYNAIVGYSPEKLHVARRTAAIIDPADGLLPAWTMEQLKNYEGREAFTAPRGDADWTIDRPPGERCIAAFDRANVDNWGMGLGSGKSDVYHDFSQVIGNPDVNPGGDGISGNATPGGPYRIIQAPGYIAIVEEEGATPDYYIISLDGRPHLSSTFAQYTGDARGHWEGNTLVIEYTNFQGFGDVIPSYGSAIYPSNTMKNLKVTTRLTRTGPTSMDYKYTVDDPTVWTKVWTVQHNLTLDNSYRVSPVPCREGIDDIGTTLYGWRLDEEQAMQNAEETRVARKPGIARMKAQAEAAAKNKK